MTDSPSTDLPRRLHPLSVVFRTAGYVRRLIVPILIALFASGDRWELMAGFFLFPLAIYQLLSHFMTTYRLTDEQLVVRRGVLFRFERHIPLAQIQNVDLVENLLHRLFGVAEVRIETASGAEPEAVLRVLGLGEVQRIRERIFAERREPDLPTPPDQTPTAADDRQQDAAAAPVERPESIELLHLSPAELVKLGLITFRGLVVVGVGLGAALQFDLHEWAVERLEELDSFSLPTAGFSPVNVIIGLAILSALAVTLLSIVWAVVTLYDYRLLRVGEDLRVTCGLFTRLTATIPRQRIQLLSVRQSLLHRLFGSVSVSIETAGGSGEAENVPVSRRWLVPLAPEEKLPELLHEIQPEFQLHDCSWQPLSDAGRRRMVRKVAIVGGLFLGLVAVAVEVWIWLLSFVPDAALSRSVIAWSIPAGAVLLWLLWIAHARAAARAVGYAQHPRGVAFRSGFLTRRTSTTNYDRIQAVALEESPFDRRWRMATFSVDTAGAGPAGHRIRIAFLGRSAADELHRSVVSRTEQTEFSWN